MTKVKIEYTLTAKTCVEEIVNFLRMKEMDPKEVIPQILEQFEGKVSTFPLGSPYCPELLKFGVTRYRECNVSAGYRVLYSVNEGTVTVHAMLSQRQDIKQLLFKRMIQA